MSSIFIQIPCSSANLGPGLDVLAVALNLYLRLNVQYDRNKPFQIELQYLSNHHLHKATTNPSSNLIITTFRHFYPLDCGFLSLTIENEIPLTRGLGSSAAAIVAGVVLANWFGQFHWTRQEMLEKCLCIETHPDNIAASLFGGLVVSCSGTPGITLSLPFNTSLFRLALIVPHCEGFTKELRKALPLTYPFKDVVYSMQRVTLLTHLLGNPSANLPHDRTLLSNLLNDVLHQPYRAPYIPGYLFLKALVESGTPPFQDVFGICVSGSGPSLLLFLNGQINESTWMTFHSKFKEVYLQSISMHADPSLLLPTDVDILFLTPTQKGAWWTEDNACAHAG